MSNLELIATRPGDKYWNEFRKLPWNIYKEDIHWVPPLLFELDKLFDKKKNPFFEKASAQYWIVKSGEKCVGRIAAIVNGWHNEHYKDMKGFYGFYESVTDQNVSAMLFNAAATWLKQHCCDVMTGPVNLSTSNECGVLIEGYYTPPVMMMNHNPPYYRDQYESFGFNKEIDLLAFNLTPETINNDEAVMSKIKRVADVISKRQNITYRHFNMQDYDNEIERARELFNDYMSDNWGFVPIEKKEFNFMAESLKQILIKDLSFFAEINGEPVGFSLTLPDVNQVLKRMNGNLLPLGIFKYLYYKPRINGLRVFLVGIKTGYRKIGLESVFYYRTIRESAQRKYKYAELSWVSEKNTTMISSIEKFKGDLSKRYRIYAKQL